MRTGPAFLLGLLAAMLAASLPGRAAERFAWRTDLEEARTIAAAEGKPLLIAFRCEP
ncbi:MAG: hypothetical protein HKN82_05480 [Akkermansiaceae bacterium]|nr:hypothetical protein [Akkermansiaceae bacterium]